VAHLAAAPVSPATGDRRAAEQRRKAFACCGPRSAIIDCALGSTLLHLQQIYSSISLSGCKDEPIGFLDHRSVCGEGPAVFAVIYRKLSARARSSAAGILDCWRRGNPKTAGRCPHPRDLFFGEREESYSNSMNG